jgi:hypothetical protein
VELLTQASIQNGNHLDRRIFNYGPNNCDIPRVIDIKNGDGDYTINRIIDFGGYTLDENGKSSKCTSSKFKSG